jgi:hypothetical protein
MILARGSKFLYTRWPKPNSFSRFAFTPAHKQQQPSSDAVKSKVPCTCGGHSSCTRGGQSQPAFHAWPSHLHTRSSNSPARMR